MHRILLILCVFALYGRAYSVLTHEAVVDSAWESQIKPLLKARFPKATAEDLKKAHAYVYGGCIIQDLGYVPLASRKFSDLTHYARSGDFVAALLRDATTIDEYAFALGALAHYASDRVGHQTVNRITPLLYPKLGKKFGNVVTYEDSPSHHIKTEFSIDVVQVSRGLYAPDAYHDFIGFEVAQDVLERAFQDTYGMPLKDVLTSEDMAIGTYRWAAGSLIPEMTKVAWKSKQKDIEKAKPGIQESAFVYSLPRAKYSAEWGDIHQKPGFRARVLSVMFRIIPKVGPFKALAFKPIPPEAEKMFLAAFAATTEEYARLLRQVRSGAPMFADVNLDTGMAIHPGEYKLADKTYISLVDRLAEKHFETVPRDLRVNILTYFAQREPSTIPPKTAQQLQELRGVTASAR